MTKIRLLNWFPYFHLVCSFHHIFLGVKSLQMFEPYLPVRVCTPEIACCYLHATSNILHLYLYLQISISISISISNIKDIRFLSPSWLTTIRQDPMIQSLVFVQVRVACPCMVRSVLAGRIGIIQSLSIVCHSLTHLYVLEQSVQKLCGIRSETNWNPQCDH